MSLRFLVSDLLGRTGARRRESGSLDLDVAIGDATVTGPTTVDLTLESVDGGILARFVAQAGAHLVCTRCLTEWDEPIGADSAQLFNPEPDEDGYALGRDGTVDLSGPVRDEIALAVPLVPLCRPDCRGLCPVCGTDLNRDPCGGHDEPPSSPFAALQDLFDPRDRPPKEPT